ncbi:MAG: GNAT family N-acetyltransferase [Candidatus Odinarchaeota archaeon]
MSEVKREDLERVLNLYNHSWITSRESFSRLSIESLNSIFNHRDTKIFIAKLFGIDAGFMILDLEGENNEYGVIAALAVLPKFQSKGLGKVLGMAAWEYFKSKGIKELRCEVYPKNIVSTNFIKSLGFEEYDK